MISSSSPPLERGLDTMILVYSLLQGHPALPACEQLLRAQTGWFTSPWVLFEAKGVLTRVYGEDPALVTQKLPQMGGRGCRPAARARHRLLGVGPRLRPGAAETTRRCRQSRLRDQCHRGSRRARRHAAPG